MYGLHGFSFNTLSSNINIYTHAHARAHTELASSENTERTLNNLHCTIFCYVPCKIYIHPSHAYSKYFVYSLILKHVNFNQFM